MCWVLNTKRAARLNMDCVDSPQPRGTWFVEVFLTSLQKKCELEFVIITLFRFERMNNSMLYCYRGLNAVAGVVTMETFENKIVNTYIHLYECFQFTMFGVAFSYLLEAFFTKLSWLH